MAPETAVAVPTPESAPAPVSPDLSKLSGAQYDSWRMKGTLPEPPKAEESAPQNDDQKSSDAAPEKDAAKPAPESDPDKKPQDVHRGTPAPERVKELLADRARDRERITALEKQLSDRAPATPAKETSAPPPEKKAAKPTLEDTNEDGTPKFKTYEDYLDARDQWVTEQAVTEFETRQQQKAAKETFDKQLGEGKARYKDFDTTVMPAGRAIATDPQIPIEVTSFINSSPNMIDLLYVIGSDPKAMQDFIHTARTDPAAALRKAAILEYEVVRELGKAAKPAVTPAKQITDAPAPPHKVEGTGIVAGDEVEQAVKEGNFAAYKAAEDAKALSRRKG